MLLRPDKKKNHKERCLTHGTVAVLLKMHKNLHVDRGYTANFGPLNSMAHNLGTKVYFAMG